MSKAYEPIPSVVQYHESCFNFTQRLFEREGIYYYFQHESDKHVLVAEDSGYLNRGERIELLYQISANGDDAPCMSGGEQSTMGRVRSTQLTFMTIMHLTV